MDVDAIVIDPEVPEDIRRQLKAAPPRRLLRFGAPSPVAVPPPPGPPGHVFSPHGRRAVTTTVAMSVFCVMTVAAWVTFVAASSAGAKEGLALLGLVGVVAFLNRFLAAAPAVAAAKEHGWRQRPPTASPDHPSWEGLHAVTAYHRRYLLPRHDLDSDARPVWIRAVDAASKLQRSEVVQKGLIDSVQVATVLPYHMWDIAERLARLSALRAEHKAILHGVDADDPGVAAVLAPQQRAQDLAAADVEERVRRLEVLAELAGTADAARRRQEAVQQLATLNEAHRDLLARVGDEGPAGELSGQISVDAQAIIEQADEAVARANEAGRSLALPAGTGGAPPSGGTGGAPPSGGTGD